MAANTIDRAATTGKLFVGIEGGASFSQGVLLDQAGRVLATVQNAPATNFWILGLDEVYRRISEIVIELRKKADLPEQTAIDALGCCLSGVKDGKDKQPFASGFLEKYPNLVRNCISRNDTIGSIFTASKEGGLVLIAGTGSNCFLLNPDGSSRNCGGWGHMIGDHGSACKLVLRAIKTVINEEDHLKRSPYDVGAVKKLLLEHFQMEKMIDILKHVYLDFDKPRFSMVCKRIAELANKEDDKLARHLFRLNGRDLARHINAVLPSVDEKLLNRVGGLQIICIGSLFKSWNLLQDAFLDELNKSLKEFTLVSMNCDSSLGAAFLAANAIGHCLDIHSDKNVNVFFSYRN